MPNVPGLRRIRQERFLSQKDVAELTGLARSTVAEIEITKRPARFSTIKRLAEALGVTPNDLVNK